MKVKGSPTQASQLVKVSEGALESASATVGGPFPETICDDLIVPAAIMVSSTALPLPSRIRRCERMQAMSVEEQVGAAAPAPAWLVQVT